MSKVVEWVWRVGVIPGFGQVLFQVRPGTIKVRRITQMIVHPQTHQPGFQVAAFYQLCKGEPKDLEFEIPYHAATAISEQVTEHLDTLWTPSKASGLKIITGGK